jgi:hypothetical protein
MLALNLIEPEEMLDCWSFNKSIFVLLQSRAWRVASGFVPEMTTQKLGLSAGKKFFGRCYKFLFELTFRNRKENSMELSINKLNRFKQCTSLLVMGSFLICAVAAAHNRGLENSSRLAGNASQPPIRRVFVRSKALLVRAAVVEEKLLQQAEFKQLRFVITRDESDADLILELRHDLLTKYVFTVMDTRTQTVVIGGKVSSLGGTVAGKVAKRFVKEMANARTV